MTEPRPLAYAFGNCRYEPTSARLVRNGVAQPLQPKVLDLLEQFLAHPGAVISRDSLMQALWPDVFVTDNSLEQVIRKLRRALGDVRPFRVVETVSGRGYRLVPPVTRVDREVAGLFDDLPQELQLVVSQILRRTAEELREQMSHAL